MRRAKWGGSPRFSDKPFDYHVSQKGKADFFVGSLERTPDYWREVSSAAENRSYRQELAQMYFDCLAKMQEIPMDSDSDRRSMMLAAIQMRALTMLDVINLPYQAQEHYARSIKSRRTKG